MCGIVGYTGGRESSKVLLNGLEKLEYRGYDSSGIAVFAQNKVCLVKTRGRLSELSKKLQEKPLPENHCGIGHTRWATHGEPSYENAHPHRGRRVTVVHNGIIENEGELRERLEEQGVVFSSGTDTEVIVHLLDAAYMGEPLEAIRSVRKKLMGSYALGILFHDLPGTLFALRKDSPLIVGFGEGEQWIASDIPAILQYTRRYAILEEGDIARLEAQGITVWDSRGNVVKKPVLLANWDMETARKDGYDHFMLKEIMEQPGAVTRTASAYLKNGLPDFSEAGLSFERLRGMERVHIVACGTAMHAGLVGKYALEQARVPCEVHIASEFRYHAPLFGEKDAVFIVSQSGETADSLAALRLARAQGVFTMGIVNAVGSSIAREADVLLSTCAGPEIAVASTKAYTVQAALLLLLALGCSYARGTLEKAEVKRLCEGLPAAVNAMKQALEQREACQAAARGIATASSLFYIGRGIDDALAREGALKLKEVSYIHCEAVAAGELKHGTISLIEPGTPVVAIATEDRLVSKLLGNIREVRARGAVVLLLYRQGLEIPMDAADKAIEIPFAPALFQSLPTAVIFQLIAYYTALERGNDVDKPRNLAKSVTVE